MKLIFLLAVLPTIPLAGAQTKSTVSTCKTAFSAALPPNSSLEIDARTVEMEIVGTDQSTLGVSCLLRNQNDGEKIRLSMASSSAVSKLQIRGGPRNNQKIRVEVPRETNLIVHERGGQIEISNVIGNKDVRLGSGDIVILPVNQKSYGVIDTSVRVGDINAPALGVKMEGFLRRFVTPPSPSGYRLLAHVGTGSIHLKATAVPSSSVKAAGNASPAAPGDK